MPILKSTSPRVNLTKPYGGTVKLHKEIILGSSMNSGSNPFEEDMGSETNPFADDLNQEKNPFDEEEEEGKAIETAESLNGSLQMGNGSTPKKNDSEKHGTLTFSLKKVLGKNKKKGKSPTEEKSGEKKLFFNRPLSPTEQESPVKNQEKKKGRRLSEEIPSPLKTGNGSEKEALPDSESRKRLSFLKRHKGKQEPLLEKPEVGSELEKAAETVAKVKEPLSVLEIHKLIQKRDLVLADRHIIELEEECKRVRQQSLDGANASKDSGRKAKDVTLLYEALESELQQIVEKSLTDSGQTPHLEQMVSVIEAEEKVDKAWINGEGASGSANGGRPRELRRKWREAVKGSVAERLSQNEGSQNGPIAQCLGSLKEQTVTDLISVRKNIIAAYPKEYEVFNVYVKSYHEGVSSCLSEMGQKELEIQDLYIFLQWCHNVYFREVMGHAELAAHIRKQQLGPLLPAETVQTLEDQCLSTVQTQITKHMEQELCTEQQKWKQESKMFQSELANKVIQTLKEHVEKSAAITQELGVRIALCCLRSLADFLQSFQTSVQGFYERCLELPASAEWLVPQTIALVNCCPAFRDYIDRLMQKVSTDGEEEKKKAVVSLDKIVKGGNKLLTEKLFDELKPCFSKLLKKKWLQSTESFESLITTIQEHFNQFRKMKTPPYQALVNDVHVRVVIEYIGAVMQVRIICRTTEIRTKVAGRLSEESAQLKQLFESLDSTMSWLDPAIDHLAEIIKVKETSSIQLEVGALARSYPDIRKKHISAILDVKGDVSQANRQNILETLQDFDSNEDGAGPSRARALFAEINVMPEVRCANLNMNSVSHCTWGCLSMFRQRGVRTT
ncbi:exocyst complex component 3-like [Heptranchias perlo]|uniref:exocyst complex component 3-like n=1 Tax=Heptranchias perlo TaxID=212740 RepID=UPI0035595B77